ncbi:hypothetical protein BDR26DRAFT_852570 [Obelidium mucronatum]|nr:hypothetical protein BDR26DRAFT_852570 [Obelidium mucronatum]
MNPTNPPSSDNDSPPSQHQQQQQSSADQERQLQNRLAQRQHQERKKRRIQELEQQVLELEQRQQQQRGLRAVAVGSSSNQSLYSPARSVGTSSAFKPFPTIPHGNLKELPVPAEKDQIKQLPPAVRRTVQNRLAQRASRQRKKERIRELEARLTELLNNTGDDDGAPPQNLYYAQAPLPPQAPSQQQQQLPIPATAPVPYESQVDLEKVRQTEIRLRELEAENARLRILAGQAERAAVERVASLSSANSSEYGNSTRPSSPESLHDGMVVLPPIRNMFPSPPQAAPAAGPYSASSSAAPLPPNRYQQQQQQQQQQYSYNAPSPGPTYSPQQYIQSPLAPHHQSIRRPEYDNSSPYPQPRAYSAPQQYQPQQYQYGPHPPPPVHHHHQPPPMQQQQQQHPQQHQQQQHLHQQQQQHLHQSTTNQSYLNNTTRQNYDDRQE